MRAAATSVLPSGPIAEADAIQTLKTMPSARERIVLFWEIGDRAFGHVRRSPR